MHVMTLSEFYENGCDKFGENFLSRLRKEVLRPTHALSFSTRYSLYPRLHNENVAEHSFYVSLFTLMIHEYYDFDLKTALVMALMHDLPEIHVSDVNHSIKQRYPQIRDAVQRAEFEFVMSSCSTALSSAFINSHGDSIEALIVKMSDALSVIQWVDSERRLGNNNIDFVLIEAEQRVKELYVTLKPHLRKVSEEE